MRLRAEVQEVPRGLTRRLASLLVRIVALATIAAAAVAGFGAFRVWQQGEVDERRPADAIVVMGAAQYDGTPSPVFEARLAHAVELFNSGVATRFVVTGGKLEGDRTTEAAAARAYAIVHGVPEAAIFGEDAANNTLDSLRAVAGEMDARGLRSAVFVSDPTHMLRVLRIADDLGIEAYGSPTRTSPVAADPVRRLRATAHELGALGIYLVTGG
ncbi:MAG TPA: YdcF family protein [Candidatus Limnocylindrales bacterium]|nr:YdcF family protein [Candidatus Limnocylindrales bacterium]